MQNHRTLLAVVLTVVAILLWPRLSGLLGINTPTAEGQNSTKALSSVAVNGAITPVHSSANASLVPGEAAGGPGLGAPVSALPSGHKIKVETPLYTAVFNSTGGLLEGFNLKKYNQSLTDKSGFAIVSSAASQAAPFGLFYNSNPSWKYGAWHASSNEGLSLKDKDSGKLSFIWEYSGLKLVRELTFNAASYSIVEKVHVENATSGALSLAFSFTTGATTLSEADSKNNVTKISYYDANEKFYNLDNHDDLKIGKQVENVAWADVQSNFFISAVVPDKAATLKAKLENDVFRVLLEGKPISLASGEQSDFGATYYMGPKLKTFMEDVPGNLSAALDYGWFSVISIPMIKFLNFIYTYLGNYGLAIIALTLVVKMCLWPLARKSYKSMEKMRQLQPMIKKIQEQYADDRQKAGAETMRLYKTYKVNPAGGCLPLFLQIPIFIGLYRALLSAVELRHAPFIAHLPFTDTIWLADLSAKDPFFITPIIMGVSMFLQQKMSPPMGDPTQAKVMMLMPVIFTFLFCNFPAGLVLYWLVNNVFSILQQWFTMRGARKQKVTK